MIYQEHSWWDCFARQIVLYVEIKADYDIESSFEKTYRYKHPGFSKYALGLLDDLLPSKFSVAYCDA